MTFQPPLPTRIPSLFPSISNHQKLGFQPGFQPVPSNPPYNPPQRVYTRAWECARTRKRDTINHRASDMRVDFDDVPPLGTVIASPDGQRHDLTLVRVDPHIRKDGKPSHILWWRETGTGYIASSGLRSNSVNWKRRDLPGEGGRGR